MATYPTPAPKKRRAPLVLVILAAIAAAACCVGGLTLHAITTDTQARDGLAPIVVPSTIAAPSTPAAAKATAERSWKDGTWAVGSDIKPGTYVTSRNTGLGCYWARLRNFDGELNSIIANGDLATGANGRFTVKRTDKGVELSGGCVWVREG
jgi:hypothetical protein